MKKTGLHWTKGEVDYKKLWQEFRQWLADGHEGSLAVPFDMWLILNQQMDSMVKMRKFRKEKPCPPK